MNQYLQTVGQKMKAKITELAGFVRSFVFVWSWQTITFSGLLLTYLTYKLLHALFAAKYTP